MHSSLLPASIEPLEARIAPAAVFTFTDVDGDLVTIRTSKGTNADLAAPGVLTFDDPDPAHPRQLREIDLSIAGAVFAGTNLTVTAKRGPSGGDGRVNVGYIDGASFDDGADLDLGVVKIGGDLGRIAAGESALASHGVKSLTLQSFGELNVMTVPGGATDSYITGSLGSLKVSGSVTGAKLSVANAIGAITIRGSLIGADGTTTGRIESMLDIGPVRIGGDIRGDGSSAGRIEADSIASVTVGGSMVGGEIRTMGNIGPVKIGGDVRKDPAETSGGIFADGGAFGRIDIGGSMRGGTMLSSGADSGRNGPVRVGGDVDASAIATDGIILGVNIGGSLIGGTDGNSGEIRSGTQLGPVKIMGDVRGGAGFASGYVTGALEIVSVFIGGSLIGGSGGRSGIIVSPGAADGDARVITIRGDVIGGSADGAGQIEIESNSTSISIGGSVIGGSANDTGSITAGGTIQKLRIGGDLLGASITAAGTLSRTGYVKALFLPSITIGGSILAGTESIGTIVDSGGIRAVQSIGTLTVRGDIVGNSGQPVTISASGQFIGGPTTIDLAIGTLDVRGRVERANILAGYNTFGGLNNADAQIGRVIAGDWIASSAVAGVSSTDAFFGDTNDAAIILSDDPGIESRIGSILIRGHVIGTPSPSDGLTFGFGAQRIGPVKIGVTTIPLLPGAGNDTFAAGAAVPVGGTRGVFLADGFDVHIYEV